MANGPAWHDRFPGLLYPGCAPDAFPGKDAIADYFEAYAEAFHAPIRCGVNVQSVRRFEGRSGFHIDTSTGVIEAEYVVAATGPFQRPLRPAAVPDDTRIVQIHSNEYRNPEQLPAGAVLVVGAGSSGAQIAEELLRSGRDVYLSVGRHGRPPRSYRQRDFVWWLGVLNKWDADARRDSEHTTIAVSGANGGQTVDFRKFAARGMTLLGSTESYVNGSLHFAGDLNDNVASGDADYLALLDEADTYVMEHDLDLPLEPDARELGADPHCMTEPVRELNLADRNINSIVWATGYGLDFGWLNTNAIDTNGRPVHHRGVSAEPGIYFLGLPWQTRRGSSFIWGVWHDAKYIADHIAKQRAYLAYEPPGKP